MFGFYNNNYNNNYNTNLKLKVDCLINDNWKLNNEIKQLNRTIKKLKNDYNMNNNNNIDELKKEINTIKLKNDY
jgi:predicted RNase H-like nuclease (RuvC/YqgF family)